MEMLAMRTHVATSYAEAASEMREVQKSLLEQTQEAEEWRPIEGTNGQYEVSNLGRVRYWRIIEGSVTRRNTGYHMIQLSVNQERRYAMVHRLVVEAFIGPRPTPEHVVNHLDCNRYNNNVKNLEWCTLKENQQHARRMKRFKVASWQPPKEIDAICAAYQEGISTKVITKVLGIGVGTIYKCLRFRGIEFRKGAHVSPRREPNHPQELETKEEACKTQ